MNGYSMFFECNHILIKCEDCNLIQYGQPVSILMRIHKDP